MQQPPNQPDEEQYLGLTAGQLNAAFLGVIGLIAAGVCAWLFLLGGFDTVTGKKKTDDTAFKAQGAANQAVLKLTDLPAGWKARPSGDSSEEDINFEFSQGCKVLEYDTLEIAKADSDSLYGPAKQTVSSDASVFTGDAAALDAFGVFANSWNTCREEITNAFRQAVLTSATEDGIDPNSLQLTVAFEPVPAPAVGEANGSMYRLFASFVVEGQTVGFTIDSLWIRHGRMLGGFFYSAINTTPDAAEEQYLAGVAAAKLVAAEASLPDA
jgi:hypothetical protein